MGVWLGFIPPPKVFRCYDYHFRVPANDYTFTFLTNLSQYPIQTDIPVTLVLPWVCQKVLDSYIFDV